MCLECVSFIWTAYGLMYGLPLSAQGHGFIFGRNMQLDSEETVNCYCKLLGIIPMRREYAEVCPSVFVGPCWARPQRRKTVAIGKLAPVLALIGKPPPLRMSPESMSIPEMRVGILLCIGRWKTVVWLLLQSYYKWGPILMPEVMLLLIHLCFGRLDGMQISL